MSTSNSGGNITSGLDGRIRLEESNGRLVVSDENGITKLLAGINKNGEISVDLAQDGVEVTTAEDDELIWSSRFNSFKIVETDTVMIDEVIVDSDIGQTVISETPVTYNETTQTPIILTNVISETFQTKLTSQAQPVSDNTIGTEAWSVGMNPSTGDVLLEPEYSTGYTAPGSTGNTYNDFTNPGNVYTSDDTYATITAFDDGTDYYQDYYNFGFSIINDSHPVEIVFEVESHYTTPDSGVPKLYAELYNPFSGWVAINGTAITPNLTTDTTQTDPIDVSDTTVFGLPGSLINDNTYADGFKIRLKVNCGSANVGYSATTYIDRIRIDVKYSADTVVDNSVKLFLPDSTFGSEDKVAGTSLNDSNATVHTYGSSTDLWSESLTYSDINDTNFGVAISYKSTDNAVESEYLVANNLGFNLPSTTVISGIQVNYFSYKQVIPGLGLKVFISKIVVTVYATDDNTVQRWDATILTHGDPTNSVVDIQTYLQRTMTAYNGIMMFKTIATVPILNNGEYIFGPWQIRYYVLIETAGS